MPLPFNTLSRLIKSRRALDTGELLEPNRALLNFSPEEAGLEWDSDEGSYLNIDRDQVGTMKGGPYRMLGSVAAPESTADPMRGQTPLPGQSIEGLRRLLQSRR